MQLPSASSSTDVIQFGDACQRVIGLHGVTQRPVVARLAAWRAGGRGGFQPVNTFNRRGQRQAEGRRDGRRVDGGGVAVGGSLNVGGGRSVLLGVSVASGGGRRSVSVGAGVGLVAVSA
ncbi:MAG: hypothetical protein U0694_26280 [Anaerolineae bacterium]